MPHNPDLPHPQETENKYKEVVENIKNLNWERLSLEELQQLMYLSLIAAQEFAEALRVTAELYPNDENVKDLVSEELNTENLSFDDYNEEGDHSRFLEHFINKYQIGDNEELRASAQAYLDACRSLPDEVRAMSIFSREEELSGIFEKILTAQDWSAPGLSAFKFFLEKHIELDSKEGGHHDLTKQFPVDERLSAFYIARLEMYKAIPKLFNVD